MRTIALLPELPAALAYCRSQIGRDGARRHAQSNQEIEPAAASSSRIAVIVAYSCDLAAPSSDALNLRMATVGQLPQQPNPHRPAR
jgi:hypothetical protein